MKFLIIFILVVVTVSVSGGPRPKPTEKTTTEVETTNESDISSGDEYDYEGAGEESKDAGEGSEDTGESEGASSEETEPEGVEGEKTEDTGVEEEVVIEKMEEFEPTGAPETFEITEEEMGDGEAEMGDGEAMEEATEVATKKPSKSKEPKKEAKRGNNKSSQKGGNRLSEQELQDYWRAYDNCVPKMRSELGGGLETKLRNGEYKDLGYYDKCTILCFLYDNWVVENYRLNQTKLERLLDGNGGNLQSTMSQCVKTLPVDCIIAYDIYSCFAEKGATIFFKTYTR